MTKIVTGTNVAVAVLALAAFAVPALTPTPAAAWWHRPGLGWHGPWHPGCCWRGLGVVVAPPVVAVAPPVVAIPPPVVYAPPAVVGRAWIPPHWNGPYWVPGHWR